MATFNNIKKIKIGDNIFNLYDSGNSGGTVTSVTVSNATNGGLSISGSPISTSGTISIGHSNVLTSAQTTQAVYPIKIDKNGHISAYGSAVTIVNTRGTAASGGTTLSVVNTGDMYTWNNKQDKLTNPVTGTGTSGYLVKWNGTSTVTNGPQLGSSTTTFLNNKGEWATPANTDEKVTQTPTTTNATYEILFSGTADNETHTEGARKTSTLTYNPSTKTFTTTNIVATYLKATDAKITNVLEANEVHTNKWTAANIANIGGSFYISPTMESNITGATISVSSNVYTFSVSGGTFSTTAANVSWNTGSRVMATGTITKGGVEYPIGTVIGILSAIDNTSFTINNILSANKGTLDKISAASGSYTAGKVQISMYQIKDGSAYKPVGIYLTSYGADTGEGGTRDTSLDTFIDIYGGTNAIGSNAGMGGADPNVRIGYLSHLDSYTDSAGNTRQPTGWGIYTDNGYFKGVVVADSGSIGHFTINENAIYSGEHSAYNTSGKNGIFIGRPSSSSSDYYVSGGPGALWYLKSDGSAKIGAMELTSAGVLSVPAANITNLSTAAVTAVTGSFSMLKSGVITTNANRTTYNAVTAGLTLDMNGIGAGNGTTCTFKVEQNTGILTATGANITGSITATSFVAQANSKKRAEVTTDGLLIYDTSGSTLVASFGADEAIIGKAQRSRLEMDSTTLQLIDRNNKVYFVAKDLRDPSTGQFSTYNDFTGTGSATTFTLSHIANSTSYTVTVNGTAVTSGITKRTTEFVFNTAPANNAQIRATYTTVTDDAKYYTLGFRNADIRNGASSCGFGYGISAAGMYSIAEGLESSAMGRISHAEGYQTLAYSTASHAEGNNTKTYGSASHAEGYSTTASGDTSHAEGNASSASGNISHAEGYNTKAIGAVSHAEGNETQATAAYSHAQNNNTIAAGNSQTAIGQFNKSMASGVYLVIGNGTSDARHNALTVDSAGWITANEHSSPMGYVNGNSGSASISTGSSPVKLSANISLTAGTYILIGEASFAANATGVRHLAWSSSEGGSRLVTRVTRNASSGGFATRIQVSDIWSIDEGATRTLYLECYQNSGATLAVDYYWQYVRIY